MVRRRNKEIDAKILRVLKDKIGTINDIASAIDADRRTVSRHLERLVLRRKLEPVGGVSTTLYRIVRPRQRFFFCWRCGERNEINVV